MPVFAREDKRGCLEFRGSFLALFEDAFDNGDLHLLAFAILVIQLFGKRLSAPRISRKEEFDNIASGGHAAGGIDSWSEAERHLMSGRHFSLVESGHAKQRAQTVI